jgi:hypothetical protein
VYILFKNSVRTSKRTPNFTITKINLLMLFKEIIAVYSEKHAKPINTTCSITDCQSRWFIYLPLGLRGLMNSVAGETEGSQSLLSDLATGHNSGRV